MTVYETAVRPLLFRLDHGPGLVRETLSGLVALLERDGHARVADAVG